MTLRPALQTDLGGILEIYNDAILNTTAVYEYEPFTLEFLTAWMIDKQRLNFPILVLEKDNRIAGFATYGPFRLRSAYKYSAEHSVYVHPVHRRLGYGKILLEAIVELAGKNEMHMLIGGIDATNTGSIILHSQMGFEECGHIHEAAYKFGRWLDLVFMQKILWGPSRPKENES